MADKFQLRVVTPNRQLLDEEVREVTAPASLGEIGVLPDHATLLTSLEIGVMTYRTDRGQARVAVRGGFAEVADNVMTVLADDAAFPEDVNAGAVEQDLRTAEAQVKDLAPADDTFAAAEGAVKWAKARIEAARAQR